jgi:hypothetical protein
LAIKVAGQGSGGKADFHFQAGTNPTNAGDNRNTRQLRIATLETMISEVGRDAMQMTAADDDLGPSIAHALDCAIPWRPEQFQNFRW